ncbi:hypothetical protein ACI760_08315 [Capnocytophaga canimorsus]|uniref:hypothetical protein n=1 Tax=Capnocytophaga canimorsus TaxID=28188 RepID=UPI00385A2CDE
MGFFSSLKGQLGRDTGRFISNKIFGNKHASKYQRVNDTGRSLLGSGTSVKSDGTIKTFVKTRKQAFVERKKAEIQSKKEEEAFARKQVLKLEQNIEKLVAIKIPKQKQGLIDTMYNLSAIIFSNSWKDTLEEENKRANDYADIALKKYGQCLQMLKMKYPKATEIPLFERIYRQKQRKAFFQRYWVFVLMFVLFSVMGIFAYLEEDKPKTQQKETVIQRLMGKFNKNE